MAQFESIYSAWQSKIEDVLDCLSKDNLPDDLTVGEAMRYSLLGGGKRIRPVLTLAFAEALGGDIDDTVYRVASSLEMIHTYSLIHDDLPAMDNDDLRRGKATNHRVYGEGMAILAGDGLLNLAYEVLFGQISDERPGVRQAAALIAREAGISGMIGGQCLDLAVPPFAGQDEALAYLKRLQRMKTGALIRAAVLAGYWLAEASFDPQDTARRKRVYALCEDYAGYLGLAFQVRDDLLDVSADGQLLGKSVGKDARDHKLTFVTLLGYEEAERFEQSLAEKIEQTLAALAADRVGLDFIQPFTDFLLRRQY